MDNINNTENREENYTSPVPENTEVQDTPPYTQGRYPQPPEWTKNIVISETPWPSPDEQGNLSVKFNESEKEAVLPDESDKEELQPSDKKNWPMWLQIGIVVIFAIVATLLVKNVLNVRSSQGENIDSFSEQTVTIPTSYTTVPTTLSSVIPSDVPSSAEDITVKESEKATSASEEKTTVAAEKKPTSANKTTSPQNNKNNDDKAKKEVIKYFNESINRVKTEAVKVVKNHEKRTVNEDKLELPSAIKGVGKSLLEKNFTDVTEPVEYLTREEIIAKYPVPGKEFSSELTSEEVVSAVCVENDSEYEITIKLKSCKDPEPGVGTSKAMDCLNVPMIRDTAPEFITAFSAEYYDCVIRCRVDKASGRTVWANYTTPVLLKLGLDAGFVQFDADVGITFEKDYTIVY